ncbi:MAG: glycosyltransferase family 2 protein [Rickettsiaceae bacterium]|nr:glycosyltransferase family 2 protein [Rickettsiaceae bacterium]MDP5083211.1 glycosyltransferase family 2 protein [Rickettsiaceae bacterium]
MINSTTEPLIAVLMCTYNGEKFLIEQLDSLLNQNHKNLVVWVSDDGSTDATLIMLKQYQKQFPKDKFKIIDGPSKGSVINFLALLCNPDVKADYYAFSDQDDIWEADKLSSALSAINTLPSTTPILYGSRTKTISEEGTEIGFSSIFNKTPCFENALVQSIAGGNTMLMNNAAANLLKQAGVLEVISHDWWAYMLISGAGGTVIYDKKTSLLYRQHDNNQVGENTGWSAKIKRINLLLAGNFRKWNTANVTALLKVKHLLSKKNCAILEQFESARNKSFFLRIIGLWKIKIFRQTPLEQLGLIIAIILKKI